MQHTVVITMVVVMVTIQATTRGTLVLVEAALTGAGTQIILFNCIFSAHLRFYNKGKINAMDRTEGNLTSYPFF